MARAGPRARAPVFFNPEMALDRDLAVASAIAWAGGAPRSRSGWDVTPATGLRGLRLLLETDAFASFTFTEPSDAAFPVLAANARPHPAARVHHADGRTAPPEAPFDYVDIDPYGSPIPFVAAALSALRPGGRLAVTATDLTVLAGAQPAATRRRYGAVPIRGRLGPESGLRILLAFLAREARVRGLAVRPVLAYVRAHYLRCCVTVEANPTSPDPVGTIDPGLWDGPPLGPGGPYGPVWLGPLFDRSHLAALQAPSTAARREALERLLEIFRGEAAILAPFYYEPNEIAHRLSLAAPPGRDRLIAALRDAGFPTARTHVRPEGLRTEAPRAEVDRIARSVAARP